MTNTLKKYIVVISHDVVEEAELEVWAVDEDHALMRARDLEQSTQLADLDWQLTDAIGDNSFEVSPKS